MDNIIIKTVAEGTEPSVIGLPFVDRDGKRLGEVIRSWVEGDRVMSEIRLDVPGSFPKPKYVSPPADVFDANYPKIHPRYEKVESARRQVHDALESIKKELELTSAEYTEVLATELSRFAARLVAIERRGTNGS